MSERVDEGPALIRESVRAALKFVSETHNNMFLKKRKMFLRFQRIALDVSYGFGRYRSMFLIVVFLIKKSV